MIVEITTYKRANGISHEEFMAASRAFDSNYCSRCKGLIRRQLLKTQDGYMDIFLWESKEDVEQVQATFMQDRDAASFAKCLNPETLTMQNYEVLGTYEPL